MAVSVEEELYAFSYVRLSEFGLVPPPHEQNAIIAITANSDDILFIIVFFKIVYISSSDKGKILFAIFYLLTLSKAEFNCAILTLSAPFIAIS